MRKLNKAFTILIFIFLYIPMILLAVASFNSGTDLAVFKDFTFRQYANLFQDGALLRLLRNSLIIAVLSSLVATIMGTTAAVGIHNLNGRLRSAVMTMTNIPMTNPDIVTGVSLALLFAFVGHIFKNNAILGFWTLLIAHITFNLPYVILNVLPKLRQMDQNTYDAALDLGCNPFTAFTKVVIPEIMPGIVSGFLMALTYSMDDFVISYFVSGASIQTLPVAIYSMTRRRVSPKINALSTIMFAVVLLVLLVYNILSSRKAKAANRSMIRAQKEEL